MEALIFLASLVALSVASVLFGHESRPGFANPFQPTRNGWVESWSLVSFHQAP